MNNKQQFGLYAVANTQCTEIGNNPGAFFWRPS
jgi:hypothetical protein